MSGMIRIFFPLIGYFCVATVITMAAGYGYLRSSGALDDETMFQIVSLIHGIDLDEIAEANQDGRARRAARGNVLRGSSNPPAHERLASAIETK